MAAPNSNGPEPGPDASIDDIEADVEQTRNELGQTVGALADKLDVKGRAKDKAAETKEQIVEKAGALRHTAAQNPKPTVPVAAVALIGALAVGIVLWRRRH